MILLDDVGFGASSAFGGPCDTPTAERLAGGGFKYTRFHTTALCSPTRAALLSGRNHHTVGMGGITEIATSAPGYNSLRPNTCAPLAEILKLNGFATAQFGKCHEVPAWESSSQGRFTSWPSPGNGMEYFYGFIGGETNQWYPGIYENTTPVEPPGTPEDGYHFMDDMTDKAIDWIRSQKALTPDKPFFAYFAPAQPTPRTMFRRTGQRSTRVSSTRAGTSSARKPSPARRPSASFPNRPSSTNVRRGYPPGTRWTTRSSPCLLVRRRSTPGSSPTPITTSAG